MGNRPQGDPKTWPVKKDLSRLREGVAVVFAGVSSAGHVAYVEKVIRDGKGVPVALQVSEMNYGGAKPGTPPSCVVTTNFGNVTTRTFNIAGSGMSGYCEASANC